MRPATGPRAQRDGARLLLLPAAEDQGSLASLESARASDLPRHLQPGDLLVLNDAATLPASLHGTGPGGAAIELRLLYAPPPGAGQDEVWPAVLLGAGDWRTPTEHRPAPPRLRPGDRLRSVPGRERGR